MSKNVQTPQVPAVDPKQVTSKVPVDPKQVTNLVTNPPLPTSGAPSIPVVGDKLPLGGGLPGVPGVDKLPINNLGAPLPGVPGVDKLPIGGGLPGVPGAGNLPISSLPPSDIAGNELTKMILSNLPGGHPSIDGLPTISPENANLLTKNDYLNIVDKAVNVILANQQASELGVEQLNTIRKLILPENITQKLALAEVLTKLATDGDGLTKEEILGSFSNIDSVISNAIQTVDVQSLLANVPQGSEFPAPKVESLPNLSSGNPASVANVVPKAHQSAGQKILKGITKVFEQVGPTLLKVASAFALLAIHEKMKAHPKEAEILKTGVKDVSSVLSDHISHDKITDKADVSHVGDVAHVGDHH
jgi:hypothetical protein